MRIVALICTCFALPLISRTPVPLQPSVAMGCAAGAPPPVKNEFLSAQDAETGQLYWYNPVTRVVTRPGAPKPSDPNWRPAPQGQTPSEADNTGIPVNNVPAARIILSRFEMRRLMAATVGTV